jgi:23S rRNA pseudouridine2605 synthase
MRLNKYIALSTGLSRRAADAAIGEFRVGINGKTAKVGTEITGSDVVTLDGRTITPPVNRMTIMLNKPAGYVVSRDGQGSETIYDLLPYGYDRLKPVGRLDKDSSGLILLTNDGDLANKLTHPSFQKTKVYEIALDNPLQPLHRQMISDHGIKLEDGVSKLQLDRIKEGNDKLWRISMHEGRNRQIRRTFESLGYDVVKLHRTTFGPYSLNELSEGVFKEIEAV